MENRRKIDSRHGFISDRIVGMKLDTQPVETQAATGGQTVTLAPSSAAWERRMSDVFRARQDLATRMARLLALMGEEKGSEETRRIVREEAIAFLRDRMAKLDSAEEPASGLELHRYIRELEHMRLEFFQYAAQLGKSGEGVESSTSSRTSFADMAEMKFTTLLRFAFIWSLPLFFALLVCSLIVGAAILLAMRA